MSKKVKDHSYCIHWQLNGKQGVHSFGLSYYNAKMLAEAYDQKHKKVGTTHKAVKASKYKGDRYA